MTLSPPGLLTQTRAKRRLLAAQLRGPLRGFLKTEAGSAGLLLAAALVALVWANSPWSDEYESLWETTAVIGIGGDELSMDLRHWVNDGLMALFFFVIGLEVRHELSVGELTNRRRVVLPAAAALAGIVLPALLYLAVNPTGDARHAWGAVIGTDTAFLLGALAIVGPAMSTQLRVFLLTLTVFDDIVAVSIIGIVYSEAIDPVALAIVVVCLAALALLSRFDQWRAWAYGVARHSPERSSTTSATRQAAASSSGPTSSASEYTMPMTDTATMSSMTVRVSRKTRSWVDTAGPTIASAPSRNAVSVPITAPQPAAASPPGLIAR